MDIIHVINKIKEKIGISPEIEIIDSGTGIYSCSDNFTTILASKGDQNINFWADAHKKLISIRYKLIKSGNEDKIVAKDDYTKLTVAKLKQCYKEPEIDIFFSEKYADISIVAYTDTMDSIIQENKSINVLQDI